MIRKTDDLNKIVAGAHRNRCENEIGVTHHRLSGFADGAVSAYRGDVFIPFADEIPRQLSRMPDSCGGHHLRIHGILRNHAFNFINVATRIAVTGNGIHNKSPFFQSLHLPLT